MNPPNCSFCRHPIGTNFLRCLPCAKYSPRKHSIKTNRPKQNNSIIQHIPTFFADSQKKLEYLDPKDALVFMNFVLYQFGLPSDLVKFIMLGYLHHLESTRPCYEFQNCVDTYAVRQIDVISPPKYLRLAHNFEKLHYFVTPDGTLDIWIGMNYDKPLNYYFNANTFR